MKWEAGVVYHQEFKNGDKVYFRADSVQKNKRWKGLSVDDFGGRQKKAKNSRIFKWSDVFFTTLGTNALLWCSMGANIRIDFSYTC